MRIAVAGGTGIVGRYVAEAAGAAGHEPVILSRSSGVDLRSDVGLAAALDGVEVIIDTTNSGTTNGAKATASAHMNRGSSARATRHRPGRCGYVTPGIVPARDRSRLPCGAPSLIMT